MIKTIIAAFLLTIITPYAMMEKAAPEVADIYLNFKDASLASVVNYIAEQKKINLIPHPKLAAQKVSLTTREPLTQTRAWNILLTLLEMNNFSIIDVDNVHRIVESKNNKKEPLPFFSSRTGTLPKDLPDNDTVVRYVYILKNISTNVAKDILEGVLGRNKVRTNKDLATCIITDKCLNIKAAMKIIEELDNGGMRESIKIIRLKHTNAKDIALLFEQKIFDKPPSRRGPARFLPPRPKKEITYFSSTTKIIPEERQNALILLGIEQNINKVIAFIYKYLDVPIESAQSRIHIKELNYIEAPKIKKILDTIIKPPSGAKKTPLVGEFKFFEDVTIQAERPETGEGTKKISKGSGNRLIIACGQDDWIRLEKLINKLDKAPPQISLEVMVVDIDDFTQKQLGTQLQEKAGKSLAKGMTFFTSHLRKVAFELTEGDDAKQYDPADLSGIIDPKLDTIGTSMVTIGKRESVWGIIKTFIVIGD